MINTDRWSFPSDPTTGVHIARLKARWVPRDEGDLLFRSSATCCFLSGIAGFSLKQSLVWMSPDDGGKPLVVLSFRVHQLACQNVAVDLPSPDLMATNQIKLHICLRITQRFYYSYIKSSLWLFSWILIYFKDFFYSSVIIYFYYFICIFNIIWYLSWLVTLDTFILVK